jgi:hypothetical protein
MMSVLDAISGLFNLLGALDALQALVNPWRFLLSSNYRRRVRAGWQTLPQHRVLLQQAGGALVVIATVVIIATCAGLLLRKA